jgi:hypothetical protein
VVRDGQDKTDSRTIASRLDYRFSPTAVGHGVSSELAGGGDDLGLVEKAEAQAHCVFTYTVSEQDHIFLRPQGNGQTLKPRDLRQDHEFPP